MSEKVRLTKRQKRLLRQSGVETKKQKLNFELVKIEPKTDNQKKVFESFREGKHLVLHGSAGTGKTFISMYLSLHEIIEEERYEKLIIFRSAVPTHSQGFLPGSIKEKSSAFETPYNTICASLYNRTDAYLLLKNKNIIEFTTTSYVRGITLNNCIVFFDEFQSATDHEINSVITRLGENTRLILSGDVKQNDLYLEKSRVSGAGKICSILSQMREVEFVEFGIADIVRSGFVRNYLLTRERLEKDASPISKKVQT